ncbi:translation initiation factor IF-2-like [Mustela erminea]|uniref:translation initiation factor IF-2-like n=1 Tax=Mustela erminea TaxID=36723 RepID=UPI001387627D|nr:translation initiation factor IF-2-like [Mustela erminea]
MTPGPPECAAPSLRGPPPLTRRGSDTGHRHRTPAARRAAAEGALGGTPRHPVFCPRSLSPVPSPGTYPCRALRSPPRGTEAAPRPLGPPEAVGEGGAGGPGRGAGERHGPADKQPGRDVGQQCPSAPARPRRPARGPHAGVADWALAAPPGHLETLQGQTAARRCGLLRPAAARPGCLSARRPGPRVVRGREATACLQFGKACRAISGPAELINISGPAPSLESSSRHSGPCQYRCGFGGQGLGGNGLERWRLRTRDRGKNEKKGRTGGCHLAHGHTYILQHHIVKLTGSSLLKGDSHRSSTLDTAVSAFSTPLIQHEAVTEDKTFYLPQS